MNVLFATPECAPWVKTGGLGDVCGALPKALAALGHEVRVLMPAFPAFGPLLAQAEEAIEVKAQGPWPEARLLLVRAQGITLWLLDCPQLYARPCGPYVDHTGSDHTDNAERFAFLSMVAARLSSGDSPCPQWPVDVLHCHDWTTALAPAYLQRARGARAATVLTIHNLLFQGMFASHLARRLDMPSEWLTVEGGLLHWDRLCFLKGGLQFADKITTVSPTYAREIQQAPDGCGLDGMLRLRSADLVGILNGIDHQTWNPVDDALIAAPYGPGSLHLKGLNKTALQKRMGLRVDQRAMVLGLVSRLTPQKGIELVLQALPALDRMACQLCVLGVGDRPLEDALQHAADAHAGSVAVCIGFDEGLAHLIEAGADAFLMPSAFEPCGMNQMYSQAYGTPPIVRAVGGLADSVIDDAGGQGNGFAFHEPDCASLVAAIERAWTLYQEPARWRLLQRRAMAQNNSWHHSAGRYAAVYRAAMTVSVGSAA